MKSRFFFPLILQSLFAVGTFAVTKIIPTDPGTGPTTAEFYSGGTLFFDGPKIDIVNDTSFDWWYFDAVSNDGTYQLTVNFFTTLATTLGFATSFGTTNFVLFTAMYPNGTEYQQFGFAGPVTISDGLFGIKGNWSGTGFTFQGTADLSYYKILIDSPALGIKGSMTFNSVAPAHYPEDPYIPSKNLSEHLTPVIGWANAIPDSIAKIDFNLAGVGELKFTGSGYHDKNWGLQSLPQAVKSWYWGHGHMGPYSLVWFDTVNYDGTEKASGYLARDGKIIGVGSGLTARPTGANSTYPPTSTTGNPGGFHILYNTKDGVFVADVAGQVAWAPPLPLGGYTRWAGQITGGFVGQKKYTGSSVWEWVRFTL